ncbi:MAG: aminotransferase class I/II-fold pyridoxal phosphate-dependent enzyme [Myxococcota bacterium]
MPIDPSDPFADPAGPDADPPATVHPLEPPAAQVRAMVTDVLDRLLPWLERQATGPMSTVSGSQRVARALRGPPPEEPGDWRGILGTLERALGASLDTTSPGYLAYVPGGGLPQVAVADLYADLVNRFTGLWMPAPGFVTLEIEVIRWFAGILGLPDAAGGLLTSGGSLANLGAVVAARHHHLGEDLADGVVYRSDATHHSVDKTVALAGIPRRNVRSIPVDAAHRLRVDALDAAIRADRAAGRRPFLVVANAGTTAVGAVDPIDAIADRCAEHRVWLHVDAAYGGFFALTARGTAVLRGIGRADSVTLDPHKGLFLPYGTGCLIVRDREALRAAHAVEATYLPPPADDPLAWDLADLGPELSRPNRGLRVWLPVALHGLGAFRRTLDEKLDLAQVAAEAIRAIPGVRLVSEPTLSLFSFRLEPDGPGGDPGPTDVVNRRWLSATNRRRRVFLSGAVVVDPAVGRPLFVLRVCVLSYRTHADRIAMLIEDLRETVAEALGDAG